MRISLHSTPVPALSQALIQRPFTRHVGAVSPPSFERIFDFPTLAAGQKFRIVSGSTANGMSVTGEARLDAFSPTDAKVWIKAGRFGFYKEATLQVAQASPTTVNITATEPGKTPVTGVGNITTVRTGFSQFNSASGAAAGVATMQVNPAGQFIIDVQGAAYEAQGLALHLILEKIASVGRPRS